jgi:hypothetical protein
MISPSRPKAASLAERFRRLAARKGKNRALVAVAHSIPVRVYHRLKAKRPRREPGAAGGHRSAAQALRSPRPGGLMRPVRAAVVARRAPQDERDEPPFRTRKRQPKQPVQRELARAGEGDGSGDRTDDQRILAAAVLQEETLLEMDAPDGDDHRRDDDCGREWREQAERERQPSTRLAQASHRGDHFAGTEAEGLQEGARAGDAVAAEEAEELLRAVCGERESNHKANEQQTKFPCDTSIQILQDPARGGIDIERDAIVHLFPIDHWASSGRGSFRSC